MAFKSLTEAIDPRPREANSYFTSSVPERNSIETWFVNAPWRPLGGSWGRRSSLITAKKWQANKMRGTAHP